MRDKAPYLKCVACILAVRGEMIHYMRGYDMEHEGGGKKLLLALNGAAVLTAAVLLRSSYERKSLVLKNYTVQDTRVGRPSRLVFLTDLHANTFGPDNRTLIQCILDARPDAVLIGGDMMVVKPRHRMDFSALEELLQGLSPHIPIYYAEGNHEQRMKLECAQYPGWWEEFYSLISAYGVNYLLDETAELGDGIYLSGIDIEPSFYKKFSFKRMPAEYLRKHLPDAFEEKPAGYHILMAHTPQHMESYWAGGADLVLSGHYHGGTVVLPGLGPLMSPQFRFFPRFARGKYTSKRKKKAVGIVSAGLGTHSVNIRLLNKPELVVIDLLPEEMD